MTTRRLSEIDLARFCPLVGGPNLDAALDAYETGGGAWSYNPVRASTPDLVNAQPPLDLHLPRAPWKHLERKIFRDCTRGHAQIASNVEVGKILYDVAVEKNWIARSIDLSSMPIGLKETVRYWANVVIDDGDGPFIPFVDHRREHGISNALSAQIVFSMQQSWLRARYPDLEDVRLALIQFPCARDIRKIRLTFSNDAELMEYDELNSRVLAVYKSWGAVSERRARERRDGTRP